MSIGILRQALKAPLLEGIVCISSKYSREIVQFLETLPENGCVSEWRYGIGKIEYKFRVHINGLGVELKQAFLEGIRGGHPKLTAVYTKQELQNLIQQPADSGY